MQNPAKVFRRAEPGFATASQRCLAVAPSKRSSTTLLDNQHSTCLPNDQVCFSFVLQPRQRPPFEANPSLFLLLGPAFFKIASAPQFHPFRPPGLPIGPNKGRPTTVRALPKKPSHSKGKSSQSRALVKGVIREVAGFAPYERRTMELCVFFPPKNMDLRKNTSLTLLLRASQVEKLQGQKGRQRRFFQTGTKAFVLTLRHVPQARKLMKKRLGTLKRAKGKVEELTGIIAEQRRSVIMCIILLPTCILTHFNHPTEPATRLLSHINAASRVFFDVLCPHLSFACVISDASSYPSKLSAKPELPMKTRICCVQDQKRCQPGGCMSGARLFRPDKYHFPRRSRLTLRPPATSVKPEDVLVLKEPFDIGKKDRLPSLHRLQVGLGFALCTCFIGGP